MRIKRSFKVVMGPRKGDEKSMKELGPVELISYALVYFGAKR